MSKREWKPGDLAIIRVAEASTPGGDPMSSGYADVLVRRTGRPFDGWEALSNFDYYWADTYQYYAGDPSPVVVIDPESAEDMERLADLLDRFKNVSVDLDNREPMSVVALHVRRALREFANRKPKPDEPMGLGAVVEDADGERWVRVNGAFPWLHAEGCGAAQWSELDVTEDPLSEGVSA